MRKSFVALLLVLGAAGLATLAYANVDGSDELPVKLMNAHMAQEMRSRAVRLGTSSHQPFANDTTFVGFNPAYAGSNYWSIGVGHRHPKGALGPNTIPPVADSMTGYWDWDHTVHGDTLQGWWPMRHLYLSFVGTLADNLRPWHAIDIGNQISYTISQRTANNRTFGVTSAWHVDPGVAAKIRDPDPGKGDVNPNPPRWTPLAGSRSAWCGLRAHGDVTAVDAITGNPYNVDALEWVSPSNAVSTTLRKFPGYAGQWDQMLYRDVDITNATGSVSVSFLYRTRMSTGVGTDPITRTGWFDKDPLAIVADNFISSSAAGVNAPIDSFMVYVGNPVGDAAGAAWLGSDGVTHFVFDPVRRWFGELIKANEPGGYYELFTVAGNNPPLSVPADSNLFVTQTASRAVTYASLRTAWGNKIRLVFRIKTNRGFGLGVPSDDAEGSSATPYSSGGLGAAQIDNVGINLGAGTVSLGGFEDTNDAERVNNSSLVSALNTWKTSSKPPAKFCHVDNMSNPSLQGIGYQDLCGAVGSIARICNLAGGVISAGDHDKSEEMSGASGTPEEERNDGIMSPTINLAYDPGNPTAKNNMGLDADGTQADIDYGIIYDMYTGSFDLFANGSTWLFYLQSYPATQADGVRMWGELVTPPFQIFNPDKQCFEDIEYFGENGQILTSNASGVPDSIRIGLRKNTLCYRFGVPGVDCREALGCYWDNVSLVILDGEISLLPDISSQIWEFFNDTFPFNETILPGGADFDTASALVQGALNRAPTTSSGLNAYVVAPDSILVTAPGTNIEVQLKFRILPGPGNYKVAGDPCSGLRRVPTDTTRINPTDQSFWTEYILNPGKDKETFPTTGPCKNGGTLRHDQRWSPLIWCNARCDSAERNLFPISRRSISSPISKTTFASMYHEADKHLAVLGIPRNKCFLIDTLAANNYLNTTCGAGTYPPVWVNANKGYNGVTTTTEGTKILPDGLLTPGSHVQYYFVTKNLDSGLENMDPDTSMVFPQNSEGSTDAHRWQQFSVLPDAWKFTNYGGLGQACMLYVDWNDRRGNERVWVSVADSIGATSVADRGKHNGWTAPATTKPLPGGLVDINDPKYHVNKNGQPGTNWDMFGVKASESANNSAGSLGSRLSYRASGQLLTGKWAKNAPTPEMLEAYYRVVMILSGDLNSAIIGPISNRTSDDTEIIRQFLFSATSLAHKGLFMEGDGLVQSLNDDGNTNLMGWLGVSLRNAHYQGFSGNRNYCIDLIPTSVITTNGDIYGMRNACTYTLDVLQPEVGGVAASFYDPVAPAGLDPYVSGVFHDADQPPPGNPAEHWQSLVDGWNVFNLRNKQCDKANGRLAYFWNVYTNIFGKICTIVGTGQQTTEVPNNDNGNVFVDFAGIGNNPLRQGSAVVHLTLAKADRVTVKIYDVSGRLVRTLSDGQMFKAGKVDPALTWDGLDNNRRQVARGAYFVSVKYQNSRYENSRKMIVLK